MQRVIIILLAAGWGLGLLVLALWTWQRGPALVQYFNASRPPVALWATRSAAVALVGAGEALLTLYVIGNLWSRRDAVTRWIGTSAVAAFLVGGVAALACGLVGR